MPYKLPEVKRAFDKAWRDENRERKRAVDREYNRRRRRLKRINAPLPSGADHAKLED